VRSREEPPPQSNGRGIIAEVVGKAWWDGSRQRRSTGYIRSFGTAMPTSTGYSRSSAAGVIASPKVRHQRLVNINLSTPPAFIASPLHRFVRRFVDRRPIGLELLDVAECSLKNAQIILEQSDSSIASAAQQAAHTAAAVAMIDG